MDFRRYVVFAGGNSSAYFSELFITISLAEVGLEWIFAYIVAVLSMCLPLYLFHALVTFAERPQKSLWKYLLLSNTILIINGGITQIIRLKLGFAFLPTLVVVTAVFSFLNFIVSDLHVFRQWR